MPDEPAPPDHRRRRRRATSPAGTPRPSRPAAPDAAEGRPESRTQPAGRQGRDSGPSRRRGAVRDGGNERAMRDLVGAGPSQVGVSGALRARDVNRPTDEDLAEAERDVEIVRRNWRPPAG